MANTALSNSVAERLVGSNPTSGTQLDEHPFVILRRVTKPLAVVEHALQMHERGTPIAGIARALGVSRAAVRDWVDDPAERLAKARAAAAHAAGEQCPKLANVPRDSYSYVLGQYLGDGCISAAGTRGVFKLRIATCDDYPEIRTRCINSVVAVMPESKVGLQRAVGYNEVWSHSKHWPCLFPQHGPGRKHDALLR